jgi:glycosyltransferase involved in cell wall biosynthesis
LKKKKNKAPKDLKNLSEKVPTISVCMIVKDEEKFLDNCLKSIKDIADEIIIIDTGSKDKTIDIAKRYTDKIYSHLWNNSFSEARNNYFKYATGDWIFQIDADEELVREDIPILLKAVRNNEIDTILVQVISRFQNGENEGQHNAERIFRNNGSIHYEGRVHNRLIGHKKPKIYSIRFIHYGYDLNDVELSNKRNERRVSLLKKDIEEMPENPLPYHYLSCCYVPLGLYHETLDVGLKAIELAENQGNNGEIYLWTRYNVAMAYYNLMEIDKAEQLALSTISIDERYIDSYYILTLIYFDQWKWDKVVKFGEKHIQLCSRMKSHPEEYGVIISNTLNDRWNTFVLIGIAHSEQNNSNEAEKAFKKAISIAPRPFFALRAIGLYYYNKNQAAKAYYYLKKAFEVDKNDKTIIELLDKLDCIISSKKTISCCMIVKNEEEFLEKCLSSVKDYVDEIVIVDTGSTDSTVEIAKKFTDKIYFHSWENSFSKARNQVLQYATCDWIFQIDGDEELMKGSGEKLRNVVQNAVDEDIIYVSIFCSYANGTKKSIHNFERLFRNNGIIHYEGSVHNQIVGGTKASYSSIELWHYGYDVDDKKAQEKFKRTTDLLKKEIEKNPDNPNYHHYLSASYFSRKMLEEAIIEAEKAIELSEAQNNNYELFAWTYFIASMAYYNLNKLSDAQKHAIKSMKRFPHHMDSYYMLTILATREKDWNNVLKYGNEYLKRFEDVKNHNKGHIMLENTVNECHEIFILMGLASHVTASPEKAEPYYEKAYKVADKNWYVSLKIAINYMDNYNDLSYAQKYFKRALVEGPEEHDTWYMMAKYYNRAENLFDEKQCLERLIKIGTEDNFVYERLFSLYMDGYETKKALEFLKESKSNDYKLGLSIYPLILQLGNILLQQKDMEQAFFCYSKAIDVKPDAPEAWTILGELTFSLGNLEDAEIFLQKALNNKQNDLMNLLMLCEIKLRKKDFESHIALCNRIIKNLGLRKKFVINNILDLKNLFLEFSEILGQGTSYYPRLNSIMNTLDSYITPVDQNH